MKKNNEPIDPRIRLAISQWRDDAPRGTVSSFCLEVGISRKTFYALRKRAEVEGPAAVLEPKSRRPHSSPSRISDDVKTQALDVRATLEASGLDHGPISVCQRMRSMGLDAPSVASLARLFSPDPPLWGWFWGVGTEKMPLLIWDNGCRQTNHFTKSRGHRSGAIVSHSHPPFHPGLR